MPRREKKAETAVPDSPAPGAGDGFHNLRSNFVSLVSHELRTPLGVILSAAEILEAYFERLTPERRAEYLHDIKSSAQTMTQLVDEVLFLERSDAGGLHLRPAPLDLVELVRILISEVSAATRNRVQFRLNPGSKLPQAGADEALLRLILTNLLSNAAKYSNPGDAVDVSIERQNHLAVFAVHDHGIGIPAADQQRLFEAFHRAGNVGQAPGTGLGLSIVRRCVAAHHGTIEFVSAEGEGSTFTVRIPVFPNE